MSKYLLKKYLSYEIKALTLEEEMDKCNETAATYWYKLNPKEKALLNSRGMFTSLADSKKKNKEILEKYNGK